MKIFLYMSDHLLVVPIVFISFRLPFLSGRRSSDKKNHEYFRTCIISSGPALLLPDLHYDNQSELSVLAGVKLIRFE